MGTGGRRQRVAAWNAECWSIGKEDERLETEGETVSFWGVSRAAVTFVSAEKVISMRGAEDGGGGAEEAQRKDGADGEVERARDDDEGETKTHPFVLSTLSRRSCPQGRQVPVGKGMPAPRVSSPLPVRQGSRGGGAIVGLAFRVGRLERSNGYVQTHVMEPASVIRWGKRRGGREEGAERVCRASHEQKGGVGELVHDDVAPSGALGREKLLEQKKKKKKKNPHPVVPEHNNQDSSTLERGGMRPEQVETIMGEGERKISADTAGKDAEAALTALCIAYPMSMLIDRKRFILLEVWIGMDWHMVPASDLDPARLAGVIRVRLPGRTNSKRGTRTPFYLIP
ncbi:hypothetical protein C8R44DRAFT_740400 [Mycena epipterygia]|nr:hypothetical protein C8R44DRAFT_740400 [Mycena epipterygia]